MSLGRQDDISKVKEKMMEHTQGKLECGEDAALWIGNKKICTMNWLMTFKRGSPIIINEDETQANARRICQSWNSFDGLLDALRELSNIFPEKDMSEMDAADFVDRSYQIWTAAKNAKVLIAEAKKVQE